MTDTEHDPYSDEALNALAFPLPPDTAVPPTPRGRDLQEGAQLLLQFPADQRRGVWVAAIAGTVPANRSDRALAYLRAAVAARQLDEAFPVPEVEVPGRYVSPGYLIEHLAIGIARVLTGATIRTLGTVWYQTGTAYPQAGNVIPIVYRDHGDCEVHLTVTVALAKVEKP